MIEGATDIKNLVEDESSDMYRFLVAVYHTKGRTDRSTGLADGGEGEKCLVTIFIDTSVSMSKVKHPRGKLRRGLRVEPLGQASEPVTGVPQKALCSNGESVLGSAFVIQLHDGQRRNDFAKREHRVLRITRSVKRLSEKSVVIYPRKIEMDVVQLVACARSFPDAIHYRLYKDLFSECEWGKGNVQLAHIFLELECRSQ